MLGGIPAHNALLLLLAGFAGGFGLTLVSHLAALLVVAAVASAWTALALVYRQDRVVIPLLLLRLRFRFPQAISSYTRSRSRMILEEK
jgi:hypothetical protein